MLKLSDELTEWFKDRPLWIQVAKDKIIKYGALNRDDFPYLMSLCKNEAGFNSVTEIEDIELKKEILSTNIPRGDKPIKLKSISDVKGINALAPRKPLHFGDSCLTVIYGPNGSGKSGYVRILKNVCGAKHHNHVLPDVFKERPEAQTCVISYLLGEELKSINYDLSNGIVKELSSIELYDSDCANLYVTNENELSYEPEILSVFSKLIMGCGIIENLLQEEASVLVSKKPVLPDKYKNTSVANWYNTLNADIKDEVISAYCNWSTECEKENRVLYERSKEINPTEKAMTLGKASLQLDFFYRELQGYCNKLSDKICDKFKELVKETKEKRKAADIDSKRAFDKSLINGVGEQSWKHLWTQARKFSEEHAYIGIKYPNISENAKCVLCHQVLSSDAKERMKNFEDFVKSGLEKEANEAEANLEIEKNSIVQIQEDSYFILKMDACGIIEESERNKILSFVDFLRMRRESLVDFHNIMQPLPVLADICFILERSTELKKRSAQYEQDAKTTNIEAVHKELIESNARKWLSEQKVSIVDEVNRLKQIQLYNKGKKLCNTQGLSTKKSSLAEDLITKSYKDRFSAEIKKLKARRINVELNKLRTDKGRVFHGIQLSKCEQKVHPKEILSEGEFRIVSLAAFLADVEGRGDSSPFIFDDPISSLDLKYEEATVQRLVELSKSRQVIVFTHRMSMYCLLNDIAGKNDISFGSITLQSEPWGTGEPVSNPIELEKPTNAISSLFIRLKEANDVYQTLGTAEYEKLAKGICSDIRKLLERTIECHLLNRIIERFRRSVQTQNKIGKLSKITREDCKFFDDFMTQYSKYEHSQSDELPVVLPLPVEIKKDLTELQKWITEFEKRKE